MGAFTKGGFIMRAGEATIEIQVLDANGGRCALLINGLIRFVGSRDQCQQRAEILLRRSVRDRQDRMLGRALR